jgi:cytochrome c oxidase subunit II
MALEEDTVGTRAGEDTRRGGPVHWLPLAAIVVVASVVGIAVGLAIDWFPVQASGQAKEIDSLWDVLLVASVPIFVLVETVVLYAVFKWRMRPGEEELDGPPIHGNTRLEIIWTVIPAVILVSLVSYAYIKLTDIEEARANSMQVRVVGEQFAWTFFYPGAEPGGKEVQSKQLYLPVGRQVEFRIQSKDVIHDFWVPAFRMKLDAVPGQTNLYHVDTDREGEYPIVCAELCGLGHSTMRSTVHVLSRADFGRWLEEQRNPPAAAGQGGGGATAAADGKTLFTSGAQPACSSCHTLADAGASATTGPVLDDVLKGKSKDEIRSSIIDPGAEIEKGYQNIMPPGYEQSLSGPELDALVNYLSEVTSK